MKEGSKAAIEICGEREMGEYGISSERKRERERGRVGKRLREGRLREREGGRRHRLVSRGQCDQ